MKKVFHWSHSSDVPDEVRREIELHLELRAREFEAQGMSPAEARKAALAAFGDRGAIESELRHARGDTLRVRRRRDRFGALRQDVRFVLRGLLRSPGFTIVALLTLALGIGANSAIFSVVRSVLLRPLPYPESDRLVQLWTDYRARGRATPEWLQPPEFLDWRDGNKTFAAMAAYNGWGPDLTGSGDPVSLSGASVTGSYFNVVGVAPALGRLLTPADDDPGAERVVVLADPVWRERFGADRSILGRQLQLNDEPWTVIGVLPRDFRPPLPFVPDLYRAMRRPADSRCGRGCVVWRAIGRLKPGVTLAQAQADLESVAARLARDYPESNQNVHAWPIPLHEQITGPTRLPLLALSGAVAFVLLIACVNLANLLLVRGTSRARELAVRAALGAGRGRLVRQLLTETAVIAAGGGALGLLISLVGSRLLTSLVPPGVRSIQNIQVDGTVVLFTAGLTLVSGLLFGLVPAVQAAGANLMGVLRASGRESGHHGGRLRGALVVTELAFAVVLLIGAGLLLRSFLLLQRVDLGYRSGGVVFVPVGFPRVRYPDGPRVLTAVDDILARTRANPAVRSVELTDLPPLNPGDQDVTAIPVGEPQRPGTPESIWYRSVTPGYLQALRLKLVEGRGLTADDRSGTPYVGVISQEAARRFWPGKDPLGRIIATGRDSAAPRVTVVGVVATTHQDGPNQPPKAEMYVPISQWPNRGVVFVLEPAHGTDAAVAALTRSLHEVDPLLPPGAPTSIEELVGTALSLPRLYALLIGIFASAALLLAVLGVYGVMAYAVSQRQREIGVRLALGAAPGGIRRLVLGQGSKLALAGVTIGLVAATGLSRLVTRLLFGVGTFDLATYGLVPLVLGGMALLACWLPARRAMRVDPLVAIREE